MNPWGSTSLCTLKYSFFMGKIIGENLGIHSTFDVQMSLFFTSQYLVATL